MAQPISLRTGFTWFSESLAAFRSKPLPLTGIVIFSLLVSGLLSGLPWVGTLAASCWMPFGSVFTSRAARDALEGRTPSYALLADVLRDRAARLPMVCMGILSALWLEAETTLFGLLAREQVSAWKMTEEGIDFESIASNMPYEAFGIVTLLYLPLLMMTAFAPLLIVERRQHLGKSLFYSFFGILKNLPPVLLYLVCLFGLTAGAGLICQALFGAVGWAAGVAFVFPLAAAVISTISQAGIWVMYRDLFSGR